MRSRPKLAVLLSPSPPRPGSRLRVDVEIVSGSETPVDTIEVSLSGGERRYTHTSHINGSSIAHYAERQWLSLMARCDGGKLAKGKHERRALFDLPADLPPAYKSRLGSIEYTLDVRVVIPWWPDRRERYVVPVAPLPLERAHPRPVAFGSAEGGPRGKELFIETSLDDAQLEIGGVVSGATALHNSQFHKIRRVELAFVATEVPLVKSSGGAAEVARYKLVVHEGQPPEGQPLRFSTRLPAGAAPTSFRAALLKLVWHVEIRAVVAWGRDVTSLVPIEVGAPGTVRGRTEERHAPARVPPVGRERRALMWAEVAHRTGMTNDAERERMSAVAGDVSVAITLEHRGDQGLAQVAALRWPRLGLDVQIAERRWVDDWKAGGVQLDPEGHFGARLTVRGREPAQVRAFVDERVRAALLWFEDATVDDEGAMLASRVSTHQLEELERFVRAALAAAATLGRAAQDVPPPRQMAALVPAWREFAGRHGGRLEIGRMWIHDASRSGLPFELGTRWNENGDPLETVVRLVPKRGENAPAEEPEPDAMPTGARAIVDRLSGKTRSVKRSADHLEATLEAPLADPVDAEPVLDALVEIAALLSGDVTRGPYR